MTHVAKERRDASCAPRSNQAGDFSLQMQRCRPGGPASPAKRQCDDDDRHYANTRSQDLSSHLILRVCVRCPWTRTHFSQDDTQSMPVEEIRLGQYLWLRNHGAEQTRLEGVTSYE